MWPLAVKITDPATRGLILDLHHPTPESCSLPEPQARCVGDLGSLLYVTSNDLCFQRLSPPLPTALKNPPALFPKIMSFLFQRILGMCWLVTQKNSAFPPCPSKPNFTLTAHYFFLCTPSLSLPFIASPWHVTRSRNYASLTSSLSWLQSVCFRKKWGICLFVLRSDSGIKMQT